MLNDIGVLTLSTPAVYGNCVRPICVVNGTGALNYSLPGIVIGWGYMQFNIQQPSSELRKVSLTMYDSQPCRTLFNEPTSIVSDGVMCASNGLLGGKDACRGDSGGPLMAVIDGRYWLYGLVSNGRDCALVGQTGFYTKIEAYYDWLTSHTLLQ
ncbi:proclotting enzyme-like [Gigantopelta aegis]|uniref:proclotting enzyme-like n=1 Tax=Gigantopelta aegis TaxID=1735272 RepID=UPI001B88843E|nr:proclotting enzyme-like [Gigantopelta aegis]